MIDCLIMGDTIATGLSMVRPECAQVTKVGSNSWEFYKENNRKSIIEMSQYKIVVISLGTYDHDGIDTEQNIMNIRTRVTANKVVWLMPSPLKKRKQYDIIMKYVLELGDIPIDVYKYTGKDDMHPETLDAYNRLSKEINWRLKR